MYILVAPVSGGAFPVQVGFILQLVQLMKPRGFWIGPKKSGTIYDIPLGLSMECFYDLALGSSGGNVAIYLTLAGDFTQAGVEKATEKLNSNMFISSWWPRPLSSLLPSWLLGYYEGSLYCQGTGVDKMFHDLFTPNTVSRLEVWTGTLNRTTNKAELFTNLPPGESKLDLTCFSCEKINAMPLNFMCRDLSKIARVSYASAAIPLLVPNIKIENYDYADGGTCFSSPLTPLQDCILSTYNKDKSQGLHIDYLSSYDLESENKPSSYKNILDNTSITLAEIIKSLGIQDRLSGIELLRDGKVLFEEGCCDLSILAELLQRRQRYQQSLLELYPSKEIEINLESFTGQDILAAVKLAQNCMMYRLWYVIICN